MTQSTTFAAAFPTFRAETVLGDGVFSFRCTKQERFLAVFLEVSQFCIDNDVCATVEWAQDEKQAFVTLKAPTLVMGIPEQALATPVLS